MANAFGFDEVRSNSATGGTAQRSRRRAPSLCQRRRGTAQRSRRHTRRDSQDLKTLCITHTASAGPSLDDVTGQDGAGGRSSTSSPGGEGGSEMADAAGTRALADGLVDHAARHASLTELDLRFSGLGQR